MGTLPLKPEQDGMGYFYGEWIADDGSRVRVDVLPPKSYPRSLFVLANDAMHETDWLVFANGEEVVRVQARAAIAGALQNALSQE